MADFLYRFRPVWRLLGDENNPGELAGQYIYFASVEQLNDPMEGYRELVFSGDTIVWSNLFKNYMSCLIMRNTQYLTGVLSDSEFPITFSLDYMPPEVRIKTDEVIGKFLTNRSVSRHINALAKSERRVTKHELLVRLRSLHVFAIHLVAKMLDEIGVEIHDRKIIMLSEDDCLRGTNELLDVSLDLDNPAYEQALYAAEPEQFSRNYGAFKIGSNGHWYKLTLNFADDFIESLQLLTNIKWYTACFMESCSNSAIWGTYGNNHAGVCLKFKPDTQGDTQTLKLRFPPGETSSAIAGQDVSLKFNKVSYECDYSDLDFFRRIGIFNKSQLQEYWYEDGNGNLSLCADAIKDEKAWREEYYSERFKSQTTKMPDWMNEFEYRLILEDNFSRFPNKEDRYLSYDFSSLEGIIFGINTPLIDKYKIIEEIERLCDIFQRKEFVISQAYYNAATKSIGYRFLASISCSAASEGE